MELNELYIEASLEHKELFYDIKNNELTASYSNPYSAINITFTCYIDESDALYDKCIEAGFEFPERSPVAFIKLYHLETASIEDIEELDNINADLGLTVDAVSSACQCGFDESEYIDFDDLYHIFVLQNFYINPLFRGLGLSNKFKHLLPSLISYYFGCYDGLIITDLRPFKKQINISSLKDVEYIEKIDRKDTVVVKACKSLEKCGFVQIPDIDELYYLTTLERLRDYSPNETICDICNYKG